MILRIPTAFALSRIWGTQSFGQNTNPPQLLRTTNPVAGAPVVLEWASDPMTVYAVEYSTGLTNDWKLAQDNFPPQGTNTVWSDAGSESG
jgi:hypothetical protein